MTAWPKRRPHGLTERRDRGPRGRQPWAPLHGGNARRRAPHLPPPWQEEPGRGRRPCAVAGSTARARRRGQQPEGAAARPPLFTREATSRTNSSAPNLDRVLILIAAEPVFSESQLARALIAAEAAGIRPLIALNKSDLAESFARAWERLLPYRRMGAGQHYGVLPLSLALSSAVDRAARMQQLTAKTTLVLGPSGSGKSTLINLLVPGAAVLTGALSQALNSGRH